MSALAPTTAHYGRWTLVSRLASGAFGEVWTATDGSGVNAVVKRLREPPGSELNALRRVGHPGVVRALDAGVEPEPYLVMERAPGAPEVGPLAPERVRHLLTHLADALAAVHQAGLVHGDIKPDNVLVDGNSVVLIDFGLAGGGGGTARYAAPEVLSGGAATTAADVYAMGRTALQWLDGPEALTDHGARPVRGDDTLKEWVDRLLAPTPAARPTADQLADGLVATGSVLAPVDEDWVERANEAALHALGGPKHLDRPGVQRWTALVLNASVVDPVAEAVVDDTGGDASLLASSLLQLIECGAVVRRQRRWEVDPVALAGVRFVVHAVPDGLSDAAQEALAHIALTGPTASIPCSPSCNSTSNVGMVRNHTCPSN